MVKGIGRLGRREVIGEAAKGMRVEGSGREARREGRRMYKKAREVCE